MFSAIFEYRHTILVAILSLVMVACGGQPEDDLEPEDVFPPGMTVSDSATVEGNPLVFTVSIAYTQGTDVTVDYTFADISSSVGADYLATSGTLTIPASQDILFASLTLATIADAIDEDDEQLTFDLANPVGANLVDSSGLGSIVDNNPLPSISIYTVSITEGETAVVQVSLSEVSGREVSFNYSSSDGSALSGEDYQISTGSGVIPAGSSSTSLSVVSVNNLIPEPVETLAVALSNLANANPNVVSANIIIGDDDAGNLPWAYLSDVTATEGSDLIFNVTFLFPTPVAASFDYQTFNGSATQTSDYIAASSTANLGVGVSSLSITISGVDDSVYEGTETFTLSLSNLVNLNVGDDYGIGTINDNESFPDILVYDTNFTEGGSAVFAVSLTGMNASEVTYSYATTSGTAASGVDFVSTSGIGTIAPLALSAMHSVATVDDTLDEDSETFSLDISSVVNANPLDNSGLATMADNDNPPLIYISDVSVLEGATLNFIATISAISSKQITFVYQTYDITATSGADYVGGSWLTTIPAGSSSVVMSIPSIQELLNEPDETFAVSLGSLINVQAGVLGAQGTIQNEDVPPSLQILDSIVDEGNNALVLVTLSHASISDIVFDYTTVNGTATSVGDFVAASSTVTISPMNTYHLLVISTVEDFVQESTEAFSVTLSSVSGATAVDVLSNIVINDDDIVPNIFIADASITEGQTAVLSVTLAEAPTRDVVIDYQSYDGTAVNVSDYTSILGQFTIPVGNLTGALTVVSINDLIVENTESMIVSLAMVSGGDIGGDMLGMVTITDDDVWPEISVNSVSAEEGSTFLFVVSLNIPAPQPVYFDYATADSSATQPGDYAALSGSSSLDTGVQAVTFAVNTVENLVDQSNRDYTFNLSNVTFATVSISSGTGTIIDDDATINVFDISGTEGDTVSFIVSLSKILSSDVTFSYLSSSGTAIQGIDYSALSGTGTVIAGNTQSILTTIFTDDISYENAENFNLTLSSLSSHGVAGDLFAQGTIIDNDLPPEVYISDVVAIESQNLGFLVTLNKSPALEVTLSYASLNGTATAGSDYTTASGLVTFALGVQQVTIAVGGLEDAIDEGTENFTLSLAALGNATIVDGIGNGQIDDNESTLYIFDASANEGETLLFKASLSRALNIDSWFSYNTQLNGTASASDLTSVSVTTVTITSGSTEIQLPVASVQDIQFEADETFGVTLTSLNKLLVGTISATGTIVNDDAIPVIDVFNVAVGEGGSAQIMISLSNLTADPVTFNYTTLDNTATGGGTDYNSVSGFATIAGGSAVRLIDINTVDDALFEGDEVFNLSISSISNANPGNILGAVTILENDPAPKIFVTNVSASEGTTATVVITLDFPHSQTASFNYNTTGITAADGTDFVDTAGVATIGPGQMTIQIGVPLTADNIYEYNEYLAFDLAGLVNLTAGQTSGTVSILEASSPPNLYVYGDAKLEGLQGVALVSLSGNTTQRPVNFTYTTIEGTATAGVDFTAVSGSGSIASGLTSFGITVPFIAETLFESDETLAVSLSAVDGANVIGSYGIISIVNDDPAPDIYIDDAVVVENGTVMNFLVSLSTPGAFPTVFQFNTSAGTATEGVDYTAATGEGSIGAGSVATWVQVLVNDDIIDEPTEYFDVVLSSLNYANVGDIVGSGAVTDDDAAPFIYLGDALAVEGSTLSFNVSLSLFSGQIITVNYSTMDVGSATSGIDYTMTAGTLTILAGVSVATIQVPATADLLYESTESFQVSFSGLSNVQNGDGLGVGSISDNNTPPTLWVSDANVNEGSTATLQVTLSEISGTDAVFSWVTQDNSALSGTDYTAVSSTVTVSAGNLSTSINVVTINDSIYQGNLLFHVSLTAVSGVGFGDSLGNVSIIDGETPPISYFLVGGINDPTTTGTAESVNVTAYDILGDVKTDYVGTITFSSDDSLASLPSNYTFTGGDNGVVTLSNSVTFGLNGTFYVRAEELGAATIYGQQSNIDVSNPAAPCNVSSAGFQVSSSSGSETNTSVDFVVALSEYCSSGVTISYNTYDGTATAGSDYTAASGVLTIPSGNNTGNINIAVINDTNLEASSETFKISLSDVGPASVTLSSSLHTYTIFDDEGTPPCSASTIGFLNSSGSGDESVADPGFTVSLSQTCGSDVTVDYSFTDLSATNGSDYSGVAGTVTVLSGSLTTAIPVTITDDASAETPESFRVNLFNAGPNDVSVGLSARNYTINDNDGGPAGCSTTVEFAQQNGTALESVTIVSAVVTSSAACSTHGITVDYSTANLSATAGSDYTFSSGTVSFAINQTSVTISIPVADDATVESTESFKIDLSNIQPAGSPTLGNSVYTHSILDNDGTSNIYYVRKTGSDANTGASAAQAWLTLGHALTNVAAGDTVFVGAGDYSESLVLQVAGTLGSPIQWIGDVTGANTGDPGGVTLSDSGSNRVIDVNNKGYNTFDSFVITGATSGEGVFSGSGAPGGVIFKNNTITGNATGVSLRNAGAMVFENNIVSSNTSAGVSLDQGSSDTIIRNNLIVNNSGKGLDLIKNNSNVTVINNTFDSNTGNQIEVGQNGSATITNNIITNGGAGGIVKVSTGTATINYNDVWNNTTDYSGFSAGTNDISSDPSFVGSGNYRVGSTSATIDAGSANASTITFSDGSSMADRSTRSDGVKDANTFGGDGLKVNMGFHY